MQAFCRFLSESKKFFKKLFKPSSRHYATKPLLDMGVDVLPLSWYHISVDRDNTPTTTNYATASQEALNRSLVIEYLRVYPQARQ